jgi:UDP-sugar transporter A1/2/3
MPPNVLKWLLGILTTFIMVATGILLKMETSFRPPLHTGTIQFTSASRNVSFKDSVFIKRLEDLLSENAPTPHCVSTLHPFSEIKAELTVAFCGDSMVDIVARLRPHSPSELNVTIFADELVSVRHNPFLLTTMVEALKLAFSLSAVYLFSRRSSSSSSSSSFFSSPGSCGLVYTVPAALYVVDNNLYFLVIDMIGPVNFHLFNSSKILITALFVRIFLRKHINTSQWTSLLMLFVGVLVTQQSEIYSKAVEDCKAGSASDSHLSTLFSSTVVFEGFVLVLCMASASSFANVWSEYVYKKDDNDDFYMKNVQLYLYGVVFNCGALLLRRKYFVHEVGMFDSFTHLTLVIILLQAVYGFMVAHLLKVMDNIANVFAHAAALLITVFLSSALFSFHPTLLFFCGCVVISCSTFLYYNTAASQPLDSDDLQSNASSLENFALADLDDRDRPLPETLTRTSETVD